MAAASSPPERAPKPARAFRMADHIYKNALTIARLRQESLGVVVERLLEEYIAQHRELLDGYNSGQTKEVTAA
jgi:hypothetical protein